MGAKAVLGLVKDAFSDFGEDKAERLGAALAYYTIFSLGPLLVVLIAISGLVFGEAAAEGQVVDRIQGFLGADGAKTVQDMIKSASAPTAGIIATVLGSITLLLGALGILAQLKGALNTIWEVEPKKGGSFLGNLKDTLLSFLMVGAAGLLLLLSLIANSVLANMSGYLSDKLPLGPLFWQLVNYAITLLVVTPVFAAIFKFLPDVKVRWKDVWFGAFVTAFLFMVGQVAIGIYMGLTKVGTAFGAASSLVVILVWIYFSAQILFFGAELTQVYSAKYGSRRVPEEGAHFTSASSRAEQDLKPKSRGRMASAHAGEKASPWFK
ncbi:MAG TPA: YihY/virulence factor BrkB family protein [Chloroflexia bacterium]|nr:YihY/virulence factor BrkB family protein [Chloroflexia bacterium]